MSFKDFGTFGIKLSALNLFFKHCKFYEVEPSWDSLKGWVEVHQERGMV